jgi:hypothetical protein
LTVNRGLFRKLFPYKEKTYFRTAPASDPPEQSELTQNSTLYPGQFFLIATQEKSRVDVRGYLMIFFEKVLKWQQTCVCVKDE